MPTPGSTTSRSRSASTASASSPRPDLSPQAREGKQTGAGRRTRPRSFPSNVSQQFTFRSPEGHVPGGRWSDPLRRVVPTTAHPTDPEEQTPMAEIVLSATDLQVEQRPQAQGGRRQVGPLRSCPVLCGDHGCSSWARSSGRPGASSRSRLRVEQPLGPGLVPPPRHVRHQDRPGGHAASRLHRHGGGHPPRGRGRPSTSPSTPGPGRGAGSSRSSRCSPASPASSWATSPSPGSAPNIVQRLQSPRRRVHHGRRRHRRRHPGHPPGGLDHRGCHAGRPPCPAGGLLRPGGQEGHHGHPGGRSPRPSRASWPR